MLVTVQRGRLAALLSPIHSQEDTFKADMDMGNNSAFSNENTQDDLEQLLLHGTDAHTLPAPDSIAFPLAGSSRSALGGPDEDDTDNDADVCLNSDVQGALGLFAEASQDLATAGVELALGRHFACADYCNQAAEKAAQAVSLFHQGHRTTYDHDLRALGAAVGAPAEIQAEMATLTPFHPETFYANIPPEEADEVINAEQASAYIQTARRILRWARGILL
jgi:HEPN domain-containing protein